MRNINLLHPVLSGYGAISCAGIGCDDTAEILFTPFRQKKPQSASERVGTTLTDPVFELTGFDSHGGNRNFALAEYAVDEALDRAKLTRSDLRNYRVGVCVGTTTAGQLNNLSLYAGLRQGDSSKLPELKFFLQSSPAEMIQRAYHLTGPVLTISNACASGTDAAGIAQMWLSSGRCDIVLAVGVDELNRVPIAGFHALGVASDSPCRPFDRDRKGLNLGEGAGALIFETPEHAIKRGIKAELELLSYGNASDAYHATSPHPEGRGLETAIRTALRNASLQPKDISFLNAHGTSTLANDKCEGNVFCNVFGNDVKYLSTKGCTGHTLGAAGALELVFTAIMLLKGELSASRGFAHLGSDIPTAPVTANTPIENGRYAMSTSLAFGGSNAAAILGRRD